MWYKECFNWTLYGQVCLDLYIHRHPYIECLNKGKQTGKGRLEYRWDITSSGTPQALRGGAEVVLW